MQLTKSDVKFKVNGKPVSFSIIHNLSETFGLSFNNALDSWLVRTKKHTAKSLVKYINSKQTGCVVMTEKQYDRISKLNT
jgi:hypothetical protein